MKWLTPFILFTIVFAVGFVFLHNAGFDTWSAAGKALATLGVLVASLVCLLASAFLISVDDAAQDEQRQDLIHSALHACNKSAEQQAKNLGAWALVLDRMRGQKPILRWNHRQPSALDMLALGAAPLFMGRVWDGESGPPMSDEAIRKAYEAPLQMEQPSSAFAKEFGPCFAPMLAPGYGADEVLWVGREDAQEIESSHLGFPKGHLMGGRIDTDGRD